MMESITEIIEKYIYNSDLKILICRKENIAFPPAKINLMNHETSAPSIIFIVRSTRVFPGPLTLILILCDQHNVLPRI
jgi:hypothetical protein